MNKCFLSGRLTKDPEIRYGGSDNDMAIARFSVAVDRRGGKDTDFFDCTAFRKTAEFVEKYLKKGSKVIMTAEVHNDNYTDKNGNKRYSVQFIVDQIEFGESKKESTEEPAQPEPPSAEGWMNIPDNVSDEELPFN